MDYAKTKPWVPGQFDVNGDRRQPAEYILEYEHGGPRFGMDRCGFECDWRKSDGTPPGLKQRQSHLGA
jgi:hypothetical protein